MIDEKVSGCNTVHTGILKIDVYMYMLYFYLYIYLCLWFLDCLNTALNHLKNRNKTKHFCNKC